MAKRVAILQSNYLPWKGYFDLIHDVDLFVFYDDVQYTKNDWRNRNKIKTPNGPMWLTIPTGSNLDRLVCDVRLNDAQWAQKHWKSLQQCYSSAPHFKRYEAFFKHVYLGTRWDSLSELNQYLIKTIAQEFLGIETRFADSRDYPTQGRKLDRLMELIAQLDAQIYVSGPSAKSYIDAERFEKAGVKLVYKSYQGYPEYAQRYPPFEHAVSIVDLLFNTGAEAPSYIWGWRQASSDSEAPGER
jgi:hypothetical protein